MKGREKKKEGKKGRKEKKKKEGEGRKEERAGESERVCGGEGDRETEIERRKALLEELGSENVAR